MLLDGDSYHRLDDKISLAQAFSQLQDSEDIPAGIFQPLLGQSVHGPCQEGP